MNGPPDPESGQPNGSFPRAPPSRGQEAGIQGSGLPLSRERRSGNGGSTDGWCPVGAVDVRLDPAVRGSRGFMKQPCDDGLRSSDGSTSLKRPGDSGLNPHLRSVPEYGDRHCREGQRDPAIACSKAYPDPIHPTPDVSRAMPVPRARCAGSTRSAPTSSGVRRRPGNR